MSAVKNREKGLLARWLTTWALMTVMGMSACTYSKEKFLEYQKEVARHAAEPKTPEERCQRRDGVMREERCYVPSSVILDERSCRLRGGLFLDDRCLVLDQAQGPAVMLQ